MIFVSCLTFTVQFLVDLLKVYRVCTANHNDHELVANDFGSQETARGSNDKLACLKTRSCV